MKLQSATEFLSVYGMALLGVAIAVILLYIFFTVPQSSVPAICSFSNYLTCKNVVLGSNSLTSRAIFLLSNSQQYAIENATATINITNIGAYSGTCSPSFVLPGGIMQCVINFNKRITQNVLSSGTVYLSATVCTAAGGTNCGSPIQQTFGGTFSAHVSPLIPPARCSISLSGNSTTSTGSTETLVANVKLLNTGVAGAGVNFASNSTQLTLSPLLENTDSNGNASLTVHSSKPGNYLVTASFANCTTAFSVKYQALPSALSLLGNGCGVVTGSGIYPYGSRVNFSIAPYKGYTFNNWTGTGSGSYTGTSESANVILNNTVSESAGCSLNQSSTYTLQVLQNPSGAGVVTGGGTFAYGQNASITATAPLVAGSQQYSQAYYQTGIFYFTTPSGTSTSTVYTISLVAGGGGGGYGYTGCCSSYGGSGGGGGGYVQLQVSGYAAGTQIAIRVASGAQSNGQGGVSSASGPNFYAYATGGSGGSNIGCGALGGAGGTVGLSGSGTIVTNDPGQQGGSSSCGAGGPGGNSGGNQGTGGSGATGGSSGSGGSNFGGGGGGGGPGGGTQNQICHGQGCSQPGGTGGPGMAMITWSEPVTQSLYTFTGWSCSGESECYSGTTPNVTIEITANTIQTANFRQNLLPGSDTYTSPGTYYFTTPAASSTSTVYTVTLVGAGGNGGFGYSGCCGDNAGAGGGGGAYLQFTTSGYTAGSTITFTVGGGGYVGVSNSNPCYPSCQYVAYGNGGQATTASGSGMSASAGGGTGGGESADSGGCFSLPGGSGGGVSYSGSVTVTSAANGAGGSAIGCSASGGAGGNSGNNAGAGGSGGPESSGGGNGGNWGGGGGGAGLATGGDCYDQGCGTSQGAGAGGYASISWQ